MRSALTPALIAPGSCLLHTSSPALASKVSPAELTKLLSERIANLSDQADVQEVGRVLSVGGGLCPYLWVELENAEVLHIDSCLDLCRKSSLCMLNHDQFWCLCVSSDLDHP